MYNMHYVYSIYFYIDLCNRYLYIPASRRYLQKGYKGNRPATSSVTIRDDWRRVTLLH